MTPDLPIEFIVHGTAISLQGSAHAREAWKARVRTAGMGAVPPASFALIERLAVTIYYFPEGEMIGDIDNIVKPILDALCPHLYLDDRQVERLVVQKFESDRIFNFSAPSAALADALAAGQATVYIRLSDHPHEELQ